MRAIVKLEKSLKNFKENMRLGQEKIMKLIGMILLQRQTKPNSAPRVNRVSAVMQKYKVKT